MTSFLPHQSRPPLEFDFVDDFGADYEAWNDWQEANQQIHRDVILHVPSGGPYTGAGNFGYYTSIGPNNTTHIIGPPDRSAIIQMTVSNRTVDAGSSITASGNDPIPRFYTAPAGQDWVQLITPSQHTAFTVGWPVTVCGIDMQTYGYPQNQHFFEFRVVTAKDSVNGILTFDRPLEYTYKDHWPNYGGTFPDHGGPGSLIPMYGTWRSNWVLENLHFIWNQQNYTPAHSILWKNCLFDGFPPIQTYNEVMTYVDCDMAAGAASIEVDKFIGHSEFINCTFQPPYGRIDVQSDSVKNGLIIRDSAIRNVSSSRSLLIENSTVEGAVGTTCIGYGFSDSVTITDSVLANGITDGENIQRFEIFDATYDHPAFVWPMADIFPNNPMRTMVPGAVCMLTGGGGIGFCGPVFRVTDMDVIGTDVHFITDIATPLVGDRATASYIKAHPCINLTISGCTPLNMSTYTQENVPQPIGYLQQPGAAGRPYGSWYESGPLDSYHIYVSVLGENTVVLPLGAAPFMFGYFVSLEVTVTKAYTGIKTGLRLRPHGGPGFGMYTDDTFTTHTYWYPLINPYITGTRLITPGLTTGTQTGDSDLTLSSAPHWMTGSGCGADTVGGDFFWDEDPSVWPEFYVKMYTDQDFT